MILFSNIIFAKMAKVPPFRFTYRTTDSCRGGTYFQSSTFRAHFWPFLVKSAAIGRLSVTVYTGRTTVMMPSKEEKVPQLRK
jgi:hypothetical protein